MVAMNDAKAPYIRVELRPLVKVDDDLGLELAAIDHVFN